MAKGDIKELIKTLHFEKDPHERGVAAEKLGKMGDPQAVEPLIAALRDEDSDVRRIAAKVLGKIGDTRAVDPLIAILTDKNEDEFVRSAAAEALGNIGDPRAVEPLILVLKELLKDEELAVVFFVVQALVKIGTPISRITHCYP